MSGALSVIAAGPATALVVGVANIGGGVYGFQLSGGTINGKTLVDGVPLRTGLVLLCQAIDGGSFPFTFKMSGVFSQSFIKRLTVQKTDGSRTILLTADATFTNPGGTDTNWEWTGASALWTAAGTRTVEVYF